MQRIEVIVPDWIVDSLTQELRQLPIEGYTVLPVQMGKGTPKKQDIPGGVSPKAYILLFFHDAIPTGVLNALERVVNTHGGVVAVSPLSHLNSTGNSEQAEISANPQPSFTAS
jgi:hypothetical protein